MAVFTMQGKFYKLLALWLLLLGAGPWLGAAKLVIKGSDTMGAKLVPQLAATFKSSGEAGREGVTIEIAAEGSATGIASVIDGAADIGMLSRKLRPGEIAAAEARGLDLELIEVARDALVVVVNKANPMTELSLRELTAIFTGEVENWAALSDLPLPISAYTRNTSSGTYVAFQQLALKSRDYSNRIQKMAGNEQIAHEVAGNAGAIGYVALASAQRPGIRALAIEGLPPGEENYPLARPLYFLVNRSAPTSTLAERFIDHTLGPGGQALVTKINFLPTSEGGQLEDRSRNPLK